MEDTGEKNKDGSANASPAAARPREVYSIEQEEAAMQTLVGDYYHAVKDRWVGGHSYKNDIQQARRSEAIVLRYSEVCAKANLMAKAVAAVIEAQQALADWIVPDSDCSDQQCLSKLLEILDNQDLVKAITAARAGG